MKVFFKSRTLALAGTLIASLTVAASSTANENSPIEQYADEGLFIATPAEIIRLRKKIMDQGAAARAPVEHGYDSNIPNDVLDLEDIFELSLEPSDVAPRVFIARYQSTAINFIDSFGNHWPIRKISSWLGGLVDIERAVDGLTTYQEVGDGEDEKDSKGKQSGVNLDDPQSGSLTVTSLKHGATGNITVYLHGLSTPITIVLVTKPSMFHRNATMRLSLVGPNTDYGTAFNSGKASTRGSKFNTDLNNVLYGVSPADSEALSVEGGRGKAWLKGDTLYLQTDLAIFSPAIIEASHSNGKYKAYALPNTTRVMGTDSSGKTISMRIVRSPSSIIKGTQQ